MPVSFLDCYIWLDMFHQRSVVRVKAEHETQSTSCSSLQFNRYHFMVQIRTIRSDQLIK